MPRQNDLAVALHIDDSMGWGERQDLLSNPDNIETADWKQDPNTGRRADWGPEPTRFPPQMCFNSPDIQAAVKHRASLHGSPGWISGEGTNVSPTSMPGEPTMETYLGRMFNHGAVMVNIFSWGIGGEAMRNNFFRQATENPEALAAYAKFLRRETLVEPAPTGFSATAFQAKMHRIQKELPAWVQQLGQHAQATRLTQKLTALMQDRKWQEADKVADELLSWMSQGK